MSGADIQLKIDPPDYASVAANDVDVSSINTIMLFRLLILNDL